MLLFVCVLLPVSGLPVIPVLVVLGLAGPCSGTLRQPDTILGPAVRQVRVPDSPCRGRLLLDGGVLARPGAGVVTGLLLRG